MSMRGRRSGRNAGVQKLTAGCRPLHQPHRSRRPSPARNRLNQAASSVVRSRCRHCAHGRFKRQRQADERGQGAEDAQEGGGLARVDQVGEEVQRMHHQANATREDGTAAAWCARIGCCGLSPRQRIAHEQEAEGDGHERCQSLRHLRRAPRSRCCRSTGTGCPMPKNWMRKPQRCRSPAGHIEQEQASRAGWTTGSGCRPPDTGPGRPAGPAASARAAPVRQEHGRWPVLRVHAARSSRPPCARAPAARSCWPGCRLQASCDGGAPAQRPARRSGMSDCPSRCLLHHHPVLLRGRRPPAVEHGVVDVSGSRDGPAPAINLPGARSSQTASLAHAQSALRPGWGW